MSSCYVCPLGSFRDLDLSILCDIRRDIASRSCWLAISQSARSTVGGFEINLHAKFCCGVANKLLIREPVLSRFPYFLRARSRNCELTFGGCSDPEVHSFHAMQLLLGHWMNLKRPPRSYVQLRAVTCSCVQLHAVACAYCLPMFEANREHACFVFGVLGGCHCFVVLV